MNRLFTASLFPRFPTAFSVFLLAAAGQSVSAQATDSDSLRVSVSERTNMASALSPDGKTIAIDLQGTIWLVAVPTPGLQPPSVARLNKGRPNEARPITDTMGDCRQPAWSPDGDWLIFHHFLNGTCHLWMVDKAGTQKKQLTYGGYDDREPHWSPDGKSIVFSSNRSGNFDIWQLTLANGALAQLTKNPANDYNPAFSPDGAQIAFVSERAEAPGLYRLTIGGSEQLLVGSSAKLAAPAWQSGGSQVSYTVMAKGQSSLAAVFVATGRSQQLSSATENVFPFRASWFSSTEYLYTADGQLKRGRLGQSVVTTIPFQAAVVK